MGRLVEGEYIAECMWPGVTEAELVEADARAGETAIEVAESGDPVRYLGSILMRDDDVVFFFFAGPSSQSIETVARRAELPFERVMRSIRVSSGG
jgi:hypothetical protein